LKKRISGLLTAEKKALDWLEVHRVLVLAIVFSLLALALRAALMQFRSEDMNLYYIEWLRHLHENGHFAAIPSLKSDYTVAFQYLLAAVSYLPFDDVVRVKMLSLPFDFGNAWLVMLMVRKIGNYKKQDLLPWLAYAAVLFLPTVWVNSAIWGQMDSIYTFFSLLAIWFFMEGKDRNAFISFGFALSFKLQAIFLLPLFGFLYIKTRRFSLLNFLWIPLVYSLLFLPAYALGKPLTQFFGAFNEQVYQFKSMTLLFPNLWQLFPNDYELLHRPAILLTIVALMILYTYLWQARDFRVRPATLLPLAMFSVMIATYLLPAMHERYMYTAEILAVAYLFCCPRRWYLVLAIWLLGFSGYSIHLWQFGPVIPFNILSLVYAVVLALGLKDLSQMTTTNPRLNPISRGASKG
jgi:Gpi18-like mannosyltransferase